jgi:hypothetical protein
MKYNAEIPKTRIDTELFNKIKETLSSINEVSEIKISLSSYTRMALKFFTEKVKDDKNLNLSFKFKS